VLVNGDEVTMTRDGEQFTGSVLLPLGSNPLVSITWYEFFNEQRLSLASFEQQLQSLDSNVTLAIDESLYNSADWDDDGDAISNLTERREGSDPFDSNDPGESAVSDDASPLNFTVTAQSQSSVTFNWEDNSDSETLYRVQWRLADQEDAWQNSPSLDSLPADSTAHTVTGLSTGSYVFRVVALIDDEPYYSNDLSVGIAEGNSEIDVFGDPFLTQMMKSKSDLNPLPMHEDAWWAIEEALTSISSIDSLEQATSGGRGDILTHEQGVDLIQSWTWANQRSDNNASQSELQITALYAEVLDKRDEQWKRVWGPLSIDTSNEWTDEWQDSDSYSLERENNALGGPVAAFDHRLSAVGIQAWQTDFPYSVDSQVNADLVQNAKVYRVRGLARVAMRPDATEDDRSDARFLIQQGFGLFNSTHPAYISQELTDGSEFTQPSETYPGFAIEGGYSRWMLVPFQQEFPDKWYAFGVISITDSTWTALYVEPWAEAAGCGEQDCESEHAAVGGLSGAEYERSNPPVIGF